MCALNASENLFEFIVSLDSNIIYLIENDEPECFI